MTIEFEVIGELTAQEPLITDLLNDLISSIKNYTEVFMLLVFTTGVGEVVCKQKWNHSHCSWIHRRCYFLKGGHGLLRGDHLGR